MIKWKNTWYCFKGYIVSFFHLSSHTSDACKLSHRSSFAKCNTLTLGMVPDTGVLCCREFKSHIPIACFVQIFITGDSYPDSFSQKFCFFRLPNKFLFFLLINQSISVHNVIFFWYGCRWFSFVNFFQYFVFLSYSSGF